MRPGFPSILILCLIAAIPAGGPGARAQSGPGQNWFRRLQPEVVEQAVYELTGEPGGTFLRMDFGSAHIQNPADWQAQGKTVTRVDLLLTRYPRDLNSWEIGYDALMERRFQALIDLDPGLTSADGVRWRVVLQTAGHDLDAARKMRHGFVLYWEESPPLVPENWGGSVADSTRPPRFEEARLKENLSVARRILSGEQNHHDSTAIQVLMRHPEWQDMVVVSDWTASMYRHGAQMIRWLLSRRDEHKVGHFVLFNDGDGKYDDEKVIGHTGGIYHTTDLSDEQIDATLEAATLGGEGGDHRENDVEALIYALDQFPNCGELVLIADNGGPVRDLHLHLLLGRPLRIVLCAAYKEDIHPDYLTLAYHTGGSIHTRDADYPDIASMVRHGRLSLGENEYELKAGCFVKKRQY